MRLHSLALTGVGPFREQQVIDFDAVSASGLFLIEGPTGAGKTTIIDAIVFALYGSLSGAESDASRMRSHLCDADERTEVILEFSVGGVRHTITRNPSYDRRKTRGEGTTLERASQTLVVHDDHIPDMREAREIAIYLQQRIGLTADQFRRLVVLPQGEFDTLLRAKPRERYETVAGLIDDGFLQGVQEELKQRADEAQRLRLEAASEVDRILAIMRERAAEVIEVDEGVDPHATLALVAARATAAADAAAQTGATAQERVREAHQARARAEAARAAAEARVALERARHAVGDEVSSLDDVGLQRLATELITLRARTEPLAAWEARAEERSRESARLHGRADAAAEEIAAARAEASTIPDRLHATKVELDEARRLADRAESLAGDVERLESLRASLGERTRLADAVEAEARHVTAQADALQVARDALHAARTAHHALVRAQLGQRAAHLASLLAEDQPCPVCGSADHPSPALPEHGDLVTDADVIAAEERSARAERTEAETAAQLESRRASHADLAQQLAVIDARLEGASAQSLAESLAEATAALEAARAASSRARDLAEAIDTLTALATSSTGLIERLVAQESAARAEARAYDVAVAEEAARHHSAIGDASSAVEVLADLQEQLTGVETLRAARAAASGLPVDDDPAAADAARDAAEGARTHAEAAHASADELRVRLADAHAALSAHSTELTAARQRLATVGSRTEAAIQLGALVTARSPANRRNLTLQSYAVQRRFASVLDAASVHLERMSSGKFTFVIDPAASGRAQAGLGIDILDSWTGQARDPESLSGGETFYASLSLALGLADIVREEAGGASLETLFVDEGFGSLDAETLSVVLDQLDALRSRGRVVGVISHVTEMQEWVHDRIVVVPGTPGTGSTIVQAT